MGIEGAGGAGAADINAVLAQMRAMRDQVQAPSNVGPGAMARMDLAGAEVQPNTRTDFGGQLKSALQSVNSLQKNASAISNDFVAGKHDDLVKVMVEGQKANLGFQAVVQVRNRMISAYQDVMNMPI